jgi:hypothetical protein
MLSFYDINQSSWKAEEGKYKIHVGSASNDIRLVSEFELIRN